MNEPTNYKAITKQYPHTMSKEQLYKLCHISKRVAKYYLDNGIIPCRNTGHATHKYEILTEDVIAFLRSRDKNPDRYHVSIRSGAGYKPIVRPSIKYDARVMRAYRQLLNRIVSTYPDLMTADMIAEMTGYSKKTVLLWTDFGIMRWFKDGSKYYVPKELALKQMLSEAFRTIINKSKKHYDIIRQLIEMTNKEEEDHE